LIDEKAIIFFKLVWLNPPMAPIKDDITINIRIKILNFEINDSRIIGVIFCHVIIIIHLGQVRPSITLGSQKWRGAAPIFNINAPIIPKYGGGLP